MRAHIALQTRTCSDKEATSWLESLQNALLHVCLWCLASRGRLQRALPALLFTARSCKHLLWGPALLAKEQRHTCERAFLLKRTLVQTSRRFPGLNHRRMRACMCVDSIWLAVRPRRSIQALLFTARSCNSWLWGPALLAKNHSDWHALIHASAHFF